jgi:SPOR domain
VTRPGTRCADRGARKGPVLVRFLHSARLTGNLLTLGQIRHPTIKTNDYYPLIARAVERLDRSTGEARRAVYERARKAVAELRSNQPALLDAEITEERLALEEAIRMVEAEAVRKSPTETRTEPRPAPSEGMPDDDNTQSRDHGQPASPDRDDRPPALPSRQAPIFLLTASDDRHNTDIQAVAIGRAYGADHYHDDIPGSRWRGGLLVVMAVLALAVLAGTFAYRVMLGGYVFPALPPIVIAGTEPNNIVRNNSDTRRSNSSKTSVTRAGWSEKLQPINIREAPKTVPRVISTIPISSTLSTGPVAPGAATAPALDPPVASALDQHIAPSVPPLASDPVPVPASSELNETAAVAPVAREPGAPSLAVAPPVSAASVPPPASALVPVPASSEPHETAAVAPAAPIPALAPSVSAAPVSPPASAPLPGPASSEPSETAVGAPAPTPALAPPVLTAASVPPPASAPLPVPASSELNETAAVAPVAREPGAPSPALVPPLLPVASIPPPVSALSEPKEIHRVIVGLDGWAETDTSSPPALADAQGDAALSPSSRSLMQARSGTAVEVSSGGAYAVQVASERSAAEAHASFRTLRAKFPNQLGGREPMVRRTDLGAKGIYYRAMVGPFASMEKAAGMCRTLKTAGCNCLVQRNWEAR